MAVRVVFVHGACVRDGAWWWHRVASLLAVDGVASTSPLLPSCGETGAAPGPAGPGLTDDVVEVRRHLAGSEPTVVVAHSYGSMVASEAIAGASSVRHLLLIAGFLPEAGQSLASFGDGAPAPYLDVSDDGTFGARPEVAAQTFLQDCDQGTVDEAMSRLTRQSLAATQQPAQAAGWQRVPSTYLVCGRDNGTPPDLQRRIALAAGGTVELASGHHPFLSQPQAVADLVRSLG